MRRDARTSFGRSYRCPAEKSIRFAFYRKRFCFYRLEGNFAANIMILFLAEMEVSRQVSFSSFSIPRSRGATSFSLCEEKDAKDAPEGNPFDGFPSGLPSWPTQRALPSGLPPYGVPPRYLVLLLHSLPLNCWLLPFRFPSVAANSFSPFLVGLFCHLLP